MQNGPRTKYIFPNDWNMKIDQGYFSGGAGYVLSKEALTRFVTKGIHDERMCRQDDGGAEDVEMGKNKLY